MTFAQFVQDNLILFMVLGALIVAIVIYELRNKGTGGKSITAMVASRLINDGAYLIDTRTAAEFKKGHIAGAKNHPADKFTDNISRIKAKKNRAVIVCCLSGMTAKAQARQLSEQGYTDVYVLSGGIQGWRDENLPTVKS